MDKHRSNPLETLRAQFLAPPAEFSPFPFWFWNDALTREELLRQLHDFHAKEVDGFVIHPRMGLPREMPYLSEGYMELVEAVVAEACRLDMQVILYDEGMYPSGSACGMVVARNPDYASRGLQLREVACEAAAGDRVTIPLGLASGETIVSAQAVRKLSDREIEPSSITLLEIGEDSASFTVPSSDEGDWTVLLFVDTQSKGTIRGVHPGQDDGEPDAPAAADLLNPEAVQAFIDLTHERYYERLGRYFGTTIIAMFTDEPDLLGRGHVKGLRPWTSGFMRDYRAVGGREEHLPMLWYEAGGDTEAIRETFAASIRNRMTRAYYKPLADWCEAHGIGLTGHPAASDDIGLLEHFHIPGQDVVWRYIAPEQDKGVTGVHSTMGKCSSDSARHRGKRRNLNEALGVCGIEGGWTLTADDMKWYLDWLFVRGVNLISPHAFYYSIRDERRDERPPDVGPNNIWWPEYARFARYIKRMSWLKTDSRNSAEIAVLAGEAHLPWRIVKPLYEQQIEFNYLEEVLLDRCQVKDGALVIAGYRYRAILIEAGERLAPYSWRVLDAFTGQGGLVIELDEESKRVRDAGQLKMRDACGIPEVLSRRLGRPYALKPAAAGIRISRIEKAGGIFYVIVNEGEDAYQGQLRMNHGGLAELWSPWKGEFEAAVCERAAVGQSVAISVERRECLIVAVDGDRHSEHGVEPPLLAAGAMLDLSQGWRVVEGPVLRDERELSSSAELSSLTELSSWTEWKGLENYSGTMVYEKAFELETVSEHSSWTLNLGDVHEIARLWVNGKEAGVQFWKPYVFEIGQLLQPGTNRLCVSVTNSLANRYDGKSLSSGLIGPVRLNEHKPTAEWMT